MCRTNQASIASVAKKDNCGVGSRLVSSTWLWCQCRGLGANAQGPSQTQTHFVSARSPANWKAWGTDDLMEIACKWAILLGSGTPDGHFEGEDTKGRPIEIFWWNQLHVKDARWLEFTVIRVLRPHARNSERDPKISWFVWLGDPQADIAQIAMGYTLR